MEIFMNDRIVSDKMRRILALLTALSIISGVLAIFPALAASAVEPHREADGEVENAVSLNAANEPDAPKTPDYVILDADYINENLVVSQTTAAKSNGVTNAGGYSYITLEAKKASSDKNNNDPYLPLNINFAYAADDYKYVTVIARVNLAKERRAGVGFELFYTTENVPAFTHEARLYSEYHNTANGFQVLTFDVSKGQKWTGKINQFRLDFFAKNDGNFVEGDKCDIVAVILNKNGDAVYESAYDTLKAIYTPRQELSDFVPDDIPYFSKGGVNDNLVTVNDGRLMYRGLSDYNDPYASFFYKEYMTAKGRGDEILKTSDFNRTVIKFRTSPNLPSGNAMQLFVFTNEENMPKQIEEKYLNPGAGYKVSADYAWQTLVFDMEARTLADNPLTPDVANDSVNRWTYTESFNGFRMDWCNKAVFNSFVEIDEILFFPNADSASAFSTAVNMITVPSSFSGENIYDGGETYTAPSYESGGYTISPGAMSSLISSFDNAKSEVLNDGRYEVLRLTTTALDKTPSVTFKAPALDTLFDKIVVFAVKKIGLDVSTPSDFALYYKTSRMSDFDIFHKVSASYLDIADWQLIAFDMSEMSGWGEEVESFKVEFLSGDENYQVGAGCDIFSISLWTDAEDAVSFAERTIAHLYAPKQHLSNFMGEDIEYVNASSSKTNVEILESNIRYSASDADAKDPYARFEYRNYMLDRSEIKALKKDDFSGAVIRYKSENVAKENAFFQMYILDENYNPILINPDKPNDYSCYATGNDAYISDGGWHFLSLDMLNGGKNEAVWKGNVYGFRVDWCNAGDAGSYIEISDIMFFRDKATADAYISATETFEIIKGVYLGAPDVGEDETETLPEETLPEFEEEESETKPSFNDPEDTEETEESETEKPTETEELTETESESTDEETTDSETSDEETESDETESDETESETEDEEGDMPPIDFPQGFDPNAGDPGGEGEKVEGSKVPFTIACISLAGLSGASIISVIAIRIKLRLITGL